jgi:penicillin-binding protein 1A
MTAVDWILSLLLRGLALTTYQKDLLSLDHKLKVQQSIVNRAPVLFRPGIDAVLRILVLGEDRRFYSHYGVDTKATIRAFLCSLINRQLQGGSTITQQLVRVLTGRYEVTLSRKVFEMALAAKVDASYAKETQLLCYVSIAYFGWQMNGIGQACRRLGLRSPFSTRDAAQLIARLKYPEPKNPSEKLQAKIRNRTQHLEKLSGVA